MEKFFGAFIGGHDFILAGALGGLILSDGALGDGTTASTDEVAQEGPKFEEFKRVSVRNRVSELITPVCIVESGELMDLQWQGMSSVRVCLFVVMMSKVVE